MTRAQQAPMTRRVLLAAAAAAVAALIGFALGYVLRPSELWQRIAIGLPLGLACGLPVGPLARAWARSDQRRAQPEPLYRRRTL